MRFPSVAVRASALLLFCGDVLAATAFTTTVPEDLLRELTGGTTFSDLPADFPPFAIPEGILPIGSNETPNQQMVLLRTSRSGADSQLAVVNALRNGAGWMELAPPNAARQNGFIVPARELEPVTLCHDEHGMFEIRGEDGIENRVYIRRFTMANASSDLTCAQQNEIRMRGRPAFDPGPSPLLEYLPSFEALIPAVDPAAAVAPSGNNVGPPLNSPALGIRGIPSPQNAVAGRSNGRFLGQPASLVTRGAGNGLRSALLIAADNRLWRNFRRMVADAMETQGWELDSGWDNADEAGSHWLRETTDGKRMLLKLHLARVPEDFYRITYELAELGR